MKHIFLFLLVGVLLSACTEAQEPAAPLDSFSPHAQVVPAGHAVERLVLAVPRPAGMTVAAQGDLLRRASQHTPAFYTFLEATADLSAEARDAAARRLVEGLPAEERFVVAQHVGQFMLEAELAAASPDAGRVAYYTDLLYTHENQRADLFAQALPLLRGTWTEARVAEVAGHTAERARHWMGRTARGARQAEASGKTNVQVTPGSKVAQLEAALPALDALAGRG